MLPASAGIRVSVLLTGVQDGAPALLATAMELAGAALYWRGVRILAGRGRAWPRRRTAAFLAGLLCIWVAVGSGLAAYDESSVALHMVQHALLMMAAPPLLALGRPLGLASQAGPRPVQVRVNRVVRSRVVHTATHPLVAGVLYFVTMWALLVDRACYDFLIGHPAAHDASHLLMLAVGLLYWPPLVAPEGSTHRLSHPARILLLLLSMPLEALPGAWMHFGTAPVAAINTLADTRAGGELLLIAATGACSLWLVVVVVQWFAFALREERREVARTAGRDLAWTVPGWVNES